MGWDFSYSYQFLAAIFTIFLFSLLLFKVKILLITDLDPVATVVRIILVPGLLFNVIATYKPEMSIWKGFFPVFIVQFISHAAVFIAAFFLKKSSYKSTYIQLASIFSFQEYTLFIYHFVQKTVGADYTYVSVYSLIAEVFLFRPILNYIKYLIDEENYERQLAINQADPNKKLKPLKDHPLNKKDDGDKSKDGQELEDIADDSEHPKTSAVDGTGNPDLTPVIKSEEHHDATSEEEDSNELKKPNLFNTILFSYVNSSTIAILLGFAWAASGLKMIDYLTDLTGDLRNAAPGATFIIMACYVTNNLSSFKVWHPYIPIALVYRFIIMPLLVGGFCQAFSIEAITTKMCVLMASAPCSLLSYSLMDDKYSENPEISKAVFNWSLLLYVPFAFMWVAILLRTNIFV